MSHYAILNMRVRAFSAVSVLVFCGVAGYSAAGYAAETKTVTRTVTVNMLSDNPKLETTVKAICADSATKLSDKARKACDDNAFPPLTKALTFRNSGTGAEFNTLARQKTESASK